MIIYDYMKCRNVYIYIHIHIFMLLPICMHVEQLRCRKLQKGEYENSTKFVWWVFRVGLFWCSGNSTQKTGCNTKLMHWLPGCQVHFDFFTTFRNAYLIRFGKWVMPRSTVAGRAGILEGCSVHVMIENLVQDIQTYTETYHGGAPCLQKLHENVTNVQTVVHSDMVAGAL